MSDIKSITQTLERKISEGQIALPSLEKMLQSLNGVLSKEDVEIAEVAELIEKDPALSLRIINLANSPAYTGLAKMRTVADAVKRVGLRQVRSLFMTGALKEVFVTATPALKELYQIWWRHSLGCAIGAKKLAQHIKLNSIADDAYLLGLLHDIGTVAILGEINQVAGKHGGDIGEDGVSEDFAIEIIESWHAGAGAVMLEKLGFDEKWKRLVETHHTPGEYEHPEDPLFNIIQVQNAILKKAGVDLSPDPEITVLSLPWTQRLEVDPLFIAVEEVDIEDNLNSIDQVLG